MSDKCEWKGGKFNPCEDLKNELRDELQELLEEDALPPYCQWCGAELDEPTVWIIEARG